MQDGGLLDYVAIDDGYGGGGNVETLLQLCSRLAGRYNALAAATLAGLSDEEKDKLTNPVPSIGELLLTEESPDEV